jgi:hypothetical protein
VKIPIKNALPLLFERVKERSTESPLASRASLKINLPLLFIKGKGIRGMGLINIIEGRD